MALGLGATPGEVVEGASLVLLAATPGGLGCTCGFGLVGAGGAVCGFVGGGGGPVNFGLFGGAGGPVNCGLVGGTGGSLCFGLAGGAGGSVDFSFVGGTSGPLVCGLVGGGGGSVNFGLAGGAGRNFTAAGDTGGSCILCPSSSFLYEGLKEVEVFSSSPTKTGFGGGARRVAFSYPGM